MTLLIATSTAIYADRRTISPLPRSFNSGRARKIHELRDGYFAAADGGGILPEDTMAMYHEVTQAIKQGTSVKMLRGVKSSGIIVLTPDGVYVQTANTKIRMIKGNEVVTLGSADLSAEGLHFLGYDVPSIYRSISNHNPTVSRDFDTVSLLTKEDK